MYSTNIPPIMIINGIYEHQNLVAVACFLPGRAKDLSAALYTHPANRTTKVHTACLCNIHLSRSKGPHGTQTTNSLACSRIKDVINIGFYQFLHVETEIRFNSPPRLNSL